MKTHAVVALLAALALSACGKMKPLTAEQKAQLASSMEDSGRPQVASAPSSLLGRFTAQRDSKTSRIRNKVQSEQSCEHFNSSSHPRMSGEIKENWGVRGANCPMVMELSFELKPNGRSATAHLSTSFTLQDAELKELNDVDHFQMSFKMTGDEDEGELEGHGKIHSQKLGDIPIKIAAQVEVDGDDFEGEMTLYFEFPDFEAELKIEHEDRKDTFYINDEEVSEAEFMSFLEKGGPAFGKVQTSSSASSRN